MATVLVGCSAGGAVTNEPPPQNSEVIDSAPATSEAAKGQPSGNGGLKAAGPNPNVGYTPSGTKAGSKINK